MNRILVIDDEFSLNQTKRKQFLKRNQLKDITKKYLPCFENTATIENLPVMSRDSISLQDCKIEDDKVTCEVVFLNAMIVQKKRLNIFSFDLYDGIELKKYLQHIVDVAIMEEFSAIFVDLQFTIHEYLDGSCDHSDRHDRKVYGYKILQTLQSLGLHQNIGVALMSSDESSLGFGSLKKEGLNFEVYYKGRTNTSIIEFIENIIIISEKDLWDNRKVKNMSSDALKRVSKGTFDLDILNGRILEKQKAKVIWLFHYFLRLVEESKSRREPKILDSNTISRNYFEAKGGFWQDIGIENVSLAFIQALSQRIVEEHPLRPLIDIEMIRDSIECVKRQKIGLSFKNFDTMLEDLAEYEFNDVNYSEWSGRIIEVIDVFCTVVLKMVKSTQVRNPKNDKKRKVYPFDKVKMVAELGGDRLSDIVSKNNTTDEIYRGILLDELSFKQTGKKENTMFTIPISYFLKLARILKNE